MASSPAGRHADGSRGTTPEDDSLSHGFQVGDKAVYPSLGIAEIVDVCRREIHGRAEPFYMLEVAETGLRILVPVVKAAAVGIRPIAGPDDIATVVDILGERDTPLDRHGWSRRYRGFAEKVKSGSLFELAEVVRDLHQLRSVKSLSFGERRMLDTARGLVVKEFVVARKSDRATIEKEIDGILAGSGEQDA